MSDIKQYLATAEITTLSALFDGVARAIALHNASAVAEGSVLGARMSSSDIEALVLPAFKDAANFSALTSLVKLRATGAGKVADYTALPAPSSDDTERVATLVASLGMGAKPTEAKAEISSKIVISPGVATGINAMLAADTGGKVQDINKVFEGMVASAGEIIELKRKVQQLAVAASSHVAPSAAYKGDADDLTFEIVMRNANDLDWGQPGKQTILDFEVPTVVWKDKAGAVVQHPLCPDVDPHYRFKPKELAALLDAIQNKDIPWVYGHTGSGKTTKIEQLAARMGFPFVRINYDADLSRTDILGKTDIKAEAGGTTSYFKPGTIPQWVDKPCFLLHDEMDFVRSEVSYALQRILEKNGAIRLDEDGGRLLKTGQWFFQFAAANTRGQGDEYGMYPGAKVQTQAFLDRFAPFIEVDYLSPKEEEALLQRRIPALNADVAKQLAAFAKEMRQAFVQGEIMQTMSPRGLVYMARNIAKFSGLTPNRKAAIDFALEMGALSKATSVDKQKIKEIADRTFR